jgi:1-deoxy-D-xylulose-5-phosphate synthase
LDRAGLVGGDGAVHHGFLDVAYLRGFPNMALMAAIDEPTLRAAMEFMRVRDDGASAVRYPRESVPEPQAETPPFELGRAHLLAEGDELAILAYGFPVHSALEARDRLREQGHSVAVYDARFAKPVDVELIGGLIAADTPILTVEDHAVIGGFGACVVDACVDRRLKTENIWRLGLPDRWIYQGSRAEQQAAAGIDTDGIVNKAREILGQIKKSKSRRRVAVRRLSALP